MASSAGEQVGGEQAAVPGTAGVGEFDCPVDGVLPEGQRPLRHLEPDAALVVGVAPGPDVDRTGQVDDAEAARLVTGRAAIARDVQPALGPRGDVEALRG
ncbi:hypothetical protein [Streptomyces mayteni]